jgi:fibronectin type 3 domain-containing protein
MHRFWSVALLAANIHSVTLQWSWNQGNGDPATGFHVQRSLSATGSFSRIAIVPVGEHSYIDITVKAGVTYYYRVLAYNAKGNSKSSNVVEEVIP